MIGETLLGQYVIVRTYSGGVHSGTLVARYGREVEPERLLVEAIDNLSWSMGTPAIWLQAADAMADELEELAKDAIAASGCAVDGEYYRGLAAQWRANRPLIGTAEPGLTEESPA